MLDGLIGMATFNGIESKFQKEIDELNEIIKVLALQNQGNLEDKMAEFQKKIEEDVI